MVVMRSLENEIGISSTSRFIRKDTVNQVTQGMSLVHFLVGVLGKERKMSPTMTFLARFFVTLWSNDGVL